MHRDDRPSAVHHPAMTERQPWSELFGPIAADLPAVDRTLQGVKDVPFPLLADLIGHVLSKSGKKLRPALTLLAGRPFAYQSNLHRLIPMASAMELLHTATLVHDDMVDDAATRRGQSTLNSFVSRGATVLVGDYLFAKSADLVAETENVRVMTLFARTLMTICDGELHQLFASFNWKQSRDEYYHRINGKTASVFSTSTESGATLAEASPEQIAALRDYGYNLGMAFQIVDDILDYVGSEAELGKPAASDLRNGTVTLPALLLMERMTDRNPIKELFESGRNDQTLADTVALIRETGVIEDSFAVAQEFSRKAIAALDPVPDGEAKTALIGLVDALVVRSF
ncbi:MAG: heptaprenyl diphosphate synthase subunit II [Dehalococcoidia bacterium]|nr:MAG: heptaprenyl diphosphate synthase subunit II [Dehalococcoidia bacterium]